MARHEDPKSTMFTMEMEPSTPRVGDHWQRSRDGRILRLDKTWAPLVDHPERIESLSMPKYHKVLNQGGVEVALNAARVGDIMYGPDQVFYICIPAWTLIAKRVED